MSDLSSLSDAALPDNVWQGFLRDQRQCIRLFEFNCCTSYRAARLLSTFLSGDPRQCASGGISPF